jgi:hypothetical protein
MDQLIVPSKSWAMLFSENTRRIATRSFFMIVRLRVGSNNIQKSAFFGTKKTLKI